MDSPKNLWYIIHNEREDVKMSMKQKPTTDEFKEIISKRYPHQTIENIVPYNKPNPKCETQKVMFESGDYVVHSIRYNIYLNGPEPEWVVSPQLRKGRWYNKKTKKLIGF